MNAALVPRSSSSMRTTAAARRPLKASITSAESKGPRFDGSSKVLLLAEALVPVLKKNIPDQDSLIQRTCSELPAAENQELCPQPLTNIPPVVEAPSLCETLEKKIIAAGPGTEGDPQPTVESNYSHRLRKWEDTVIFAGSSGKSLAEPICAQLGLALGKVDINRFADGEVQLHFNQCVQGKMVYVIQPTSPPVNDNLVELLLMISTLKRSSAKRITVVIPYYGYARQDRRLNSRVPISAADVALMVETMGADRVISVDLHCGQIQGFFRPNVPVDNLEAAGVGLKYFLGKRLERPVIVSPDAGGVYRARKFQEGFVDAGYEDAGIAIITKHRNKANEIGFMDLVGVVDNCDAIIVDDMIDTAGTLCEAAAKLKAAGARRVFAFATHGLFNGKALERIDNSELEEVVVTDSVQLRPEVLRSSRIHQLSIATMLADSMKRIHYKESLIETRNKHSTMTTRMKKRGIRNGQERFVSSAKTVGKAASLIAAVNVVGKPANASLSCFNDSGDSGSKEQPEETVSKLINEHRKISKESLKCFKDMKFAKSNELRVKDQQREMLILELLHQIEKSHF